MAFLQSFLEYFKSSDMLSVYLCVQELNCVCERFVDWKLCLINDRECVIGVQSHEAKPSGFTTP